MSHISKQMYKEALDETNIALAEVSKLQNIIKSYEAKDAKRSAFRLSCLRWSLFSIACGLMMTGFMQVGGFFMLGFMGTIWDWS